MRPLAIAALLFASVAQAHGALVPVSQLVIRQLDDEAEDTEATDEEATDDEAALDTAPATAAAEDAPTVQAASAAADARAQELVSGAPLYNPNVAVHIVEKKQFSDKGKHELALYPAVTQVNGKFTQHFGTALSYTYHFHENFGFQVTPLFNWYNTESAFNTELINKVREEAQAATSLLLNWGGLAGVEVTPIYGKFAWFDDTLAHYSLVLNGGAGYGSTRHQLKPENENSGAATYGDTGNRFLGSVGGGFRVLLGDRFAIRLEVRDLVYTARMDKVNGCDVVDLDALNNATRGGKDPLSLKGTVSASCNLESFSGTRDDGYKYSQDVPLAWNLVREPTSDVLNLVSFYGGVSFLF